LEKRGEGGDALETLKINTRARSLTWLKHKSLGVRELRGERACSSF
jgi:hypothetical protein